MSQLVRNFMTRDPLALDARTTAREAARRMRDNGIGDVVVTEDGRLRGIVTDRDLVVRCIAEDCAPHETEIGALCSEQLVTVEPDTEMSEAVRLMETHAVRRLPVVQGQQTVGIISIGDLAVELDPHSPLGKISAAPPNA